MDYPHKPDLLCVVLLDFDGAGQARFCEGDKDLRFLQTLWICYAIIYRLLILRKNFPCFAALKNDKRSSQKSHGVVYTPRWLVDLILDKVDLTVHLAQLLTPLAVTALF